MSPKGSQSPAGTASKGRFFVFALSQSLLLAIGSLQGIFLTLEADFGAGKLEKGRF
jgi:hypothetical protein